MTDSSTIWKDAQGAPPDPVFGLIHGFLADPNPKRVLLGVGIYKGEDGKPFILNTVKKAEKMLFETEIDKEYAFPDGFPTFRQKAIEFGWGKDHPAILDKRVASIQTVSGSGGLNMGFRLLKKYFPKQKAYVTNPTWSLHHNIIKSLGFEEHQLRYYNPKTKSFDFDGLMEDMMNMEDEQIILLQCANQNPSGCDPTREQWEQILDMIIKKKHFVFFDSAYHGFGSENLDDDMYPMRTLSMKYNRVMLV